jgi:dual oxidase
MEHSDHALAISVPSTPSHFRSVSSHDDDSPSPSSRAFTPRFHPSPAVGERDGDASLTTKEMDELFTQLDADADHRVSRSDLRSALLVEAKATQLEGGSETVSSLIHHLWQSSEAQGGEMVNRAGFDLLLNRWNVPTQELVTEELDAKSRIYESNLPLGRRLLAHWSVEGPMSTFVILFVCLQIAMGVYYFIHLATDKRIHVLGWGVAFAKLGAGVLYPTLAFVLLSSSRRLASFLRQWSWISKFINWDRSQSFHIFLGCTVLFFALLHALSHLSGTFVSAVGSESPLLPDFPHPITYRAMIGTRAGVTGIIALGILILIVLTSMPRVRMSWFQVFQHTHLLIWPFVVLLLVHGTGQLISPPVLGYWLIAPMLCVLWDRVPRTLNMFRPVKNCTFRVIEDKTVVISIPKTSMSWPYQPGQYLLVRVQEISFAQWHPYTVVGSTTNDSGVGGEMFIHEQGDWSKALLHCVKAGRNLTVTLDGPFGSPSDQLSKYDRVVIVGAGIGVTPYAGWLNDITPQQTVDFYWIVKERITFTWFSALLNSFTSDGDHVVPKGIVTVHTFATGLAASSTLQYVCRVLLEKHRTVNHSTSFITGLECETRYGRPDIGKIFQTAAQPSTTEHGTDGAPRAGDGKIGVFFCGPNYLGMELSDRCKMERARTGTKWEFVGEAFQ